MATREITLQLPEDLFLQAQAAGLIEPDQVEDLFRQALASKEKVARFFEIADQLAALNETDPITEAEIEEEIRAARAEKRQRRESGA